MQEKFSSRTAENYEQWKVKWKTKLKSMRIYFFSNIYFFNHAIILKKVLLKRRLIQYLNNKINSGWYYSSARDRYSFLNCILNRNWNNNVNSGFYFNSACDRYSFLNCILNPIEIIMSIVDVISTVVATGVHCNKCPLLKCVLNRNWNIYFNSGCYDICGCDRCSFLKSILNNNWRNNVNGGCYFDSGCDRCFWNASLTTIEIIISIVHVIWIMIASNVHF